MFISVSARGTVVVSHMSSNHILHSVRFIYESSSIFSAGNTPGEAHADISVTMVYVRRQGTLNPTTIAGYLSTKRVNLIRFNDEISRWARNSAQADHTQWTDIFALLGIVVSTGAISVFGPGDAFLFCSRRTRNSAFGLI